MTDYPAIQPDRKQIDDAYRVWDSIQESSYHIATHVINLGKHFKELRDKELYKYIFGQDGDSTWISFLANPEVKFSRSSVYNFIELYELWILQLGYKEEDITDVGYKRLMLVTPITRKNPELADEWIAEARTLSQSDLINSVREADGKQKMKPKQIKPKPSHSPPCILHPVRDSEPHHFPRTRKYGKFTIPLCRECHTEAHSIGVVTWFDLYRAKLGEYLDKLTEEE